MNYDIYKRKGFTIKRTIFYMFAILVCSIVIAGTGLMFYCNNFLEYYPVKGESMYPLINANNIDEDYVYADTRVKEFDYNDILIYKHDNILVIKRVIAKANDNITIKQCNDGYFGIFIQYNSTGDWVKIEEDFIEDKFIYQIMYEEMFKESASKTINQDNGFKYIHIGENEIFYVGDNRDDSYDCVDYGPQSCDNIIGKVVFIIKENKLKIVQIVSQLLGITKW